MKRIFLFAILSGLLALGGFRQISFFQTQPVDTQTPAATATIIPATQRLPTPRLTTPTFAPTPTIPPVNPTIAPTQSIPPATQPVSTPTPHLTTQTSVPTQTVGPTSAPTQTLPAYTPTPTPSPTTGILSPGVQGTLTQPTLSLGASQLNKAGTIITLSPPADITQGIDFTLSGTIRDWSGNFVTNAPIIFTLNGSYLGQARSDDKGFFQQQFAKILDAGIYTITATFNGNHNLSYSSAATTLNVSPADVVIQTVPPVVGVTFELDGKQYLTGEDGTVDIKVNKAGVYRLQALVGLYNDPSQRIEFGRWLEDNYQPFKDIQVPTKKPIQVGLNVFNQVGETFVDLDGVPVDSQRISQFTVRSEQGDVFVLNNGQPRWLPASRVTRRVGGLFITKLLYSVINVKVDGSNVVNSSQQQFYAEPNDTWKITLLLYSLQVRVSDGLFGSAAGKSINLLFPDGEVSNYPLDAAGSAEIHGLARGNYTIEVVGAKGLGNRIPVALSRNQNASIKVLTYTDIGIISIIGFLIALSLLIYGRRKSLISTLKNRQQTSQGEASPLLVSDGIQSAENDPASPKDEIIKWS
jgi:hypothetical protein